MWLWTRDGYFSVVHDAYCSPGEVMVRARDKGDLKRLAFALGLPAEGILTTETADYRYRIKMPQREWARYLGLAGQDIDYPNFKNAVGTQDQARHVAMMRCHMAMVNWQDWRRSGGK